MCYSEKLKKSSSTTTPIKQQGIYWLLGASGGIGSILTEILVAHSQVSLIISSRSCAEEKLASWKLQAANSSSTLEWIAVDVSQRDSILKAYSIIQKKYKKITGIINCVGFVNPKTIYQKTNEIIKKTLEVKIKSTVYLDEITAKQPLEWMVYFSSMTGVWGLAGQWDYAAANSFLDGYAYHRNELMRQGKRKGNNHHYQLASLERWWHASRCNGSKNHVAGFRYFANYQPASNKRTI